MRKFSDVTSFATLSNSAQGTTKCENTQVFQDSLKARQASIRQLFHQLLRHDLSKLWISTWHLSNDLMYHNASLKLRLWFSLMFYIFPIAARNFPLPRIFFDEDLSRSGLSNCLGLWKRIFLRFADPFEAACFGAKSMEFLQKIGHSLGTILTLGINQPTWILIWNLTWHSNQSHRNHWKSQD